MQCSEARYLDKLWENVYTFIVGLTLLLWPFAPPLAILGKQNTDTSSHKILMIRWCFACERYKVLLDQIANSILTLCLLDNIYNCPTELEWESLREFGSAKGRSSLPASRSILDQHQHVWMTSLFRSKCSQRSIVVKIISYKMQCHWSIVAIKSLSIRQWQGSSWTP